MLGQPQHLSGIGTGKLRDMVTRNDMSQCVHSALGIQRVDLGIGAFIRDILLDKQMAVGQCSDLCCVGDAEDLVIFCALFEHLTDAAGRLAGNADAIILGCTEIPLALPEKELGGVPLIDATDILARELVRAFAPEKLR